jgi:hypothetical protein
MSDLFYVGTTSAVMIYKMIMLFVIMMILINSKYFENRKGWRNIFMLGVSLSFLGLAGDLVDGNSEVTQLRNWIIARQAGDAVLFTGAIGMHWDKFSPVLFNGSVIFNNPLMRRIFRIKNP